jgi:hypothetical protein
MYFTEGSRFFNIIAQHSNAFVSSWHKFKNSVMVAARPLQLQAFMSSHFCLLSQSIREKSVPVPRCPAQITHGLACAVQDWELTTCAMADINSVLMNVWFIVYFPPFFMHRLLFYSPELYFSYVMSFHICMYPNCYTSFT